KIKECKYKYPYQIHKVPVKPHFFDHFIMAAALVCAQNYIEEYDTVYKYASKYVETVETCNKEKEVCKQRMAVLIVAKVCAFHHHLAIVHHFVNGCISR